MVKGKLKGTDPNGKEIIELRYKDTKISGTFFYGEQNAKNLLAASAVAFRLGLNKAQILKGVKKFKNIDKRLNIKSYKNRYNSN